MTAARIQISGSLVPWKRAARAGRGSYADEQQAEQQRGIQLAWLEQVAPSTRARWPMTARYAVAIAVTWPDERTRDLDNGIKQILDALTGCAWDDDRRVVAILAVRTTPSGEEPCCRVVVSTAQPIAWATVAAWWAMSSATEFFRRLAGAFSAKEVTRG